MVWCFKVLEMRSSVLSREAFLTVAFMDRCRLEAVRRLCEAELRSSYLHPPRLRMISWSSSE